MNGLSFSILIVTVSLHFCLQPNGMTNTLHFKPLLYETRIYESAPANVEIVTLQAYYLPMNSSSQKIEYKLAPFDDYLYFNVNPSSAKVSTRRKIDRGIGQKYNITVLALGVCHNNRITNTSMPLSIIVSAFNQFEPEFSRSKYNLSIHNSSPVGSKILKVQATDKDQVDYNSRIFYSLTSNSMMHLPFDINSTSGQLIVSDRIAVNPKLYLITIKAQDTGSPTRYGTTFVEIKIDTGPSAPLIASVFVQQMTAHICWSMPLNESVKGYLIKYKGEHETKPTTINITTDNNKFECFVLYEIESNTNYSLQIYAWNERGIGTPTDVQYFTSRNNCDCGSNGFCKPNSNGVCVCPYGILGSKCQTNKLCPCINNGTCLNTYDRNPKCVCRHGFEGDLCQQKVRCKYEKTISPKGVFSWNSTEYGDTIAIPCPYNKAYATRLCLLMPNGSAIWGNINDSYCHEQFELPRAMANTLNFDKLEFTDLMKFASKNKSNTEHILKTIDDILASEDSYYESTNEKIPTYVDNILSVVPLSSGEEFVVHKKNIAAKVVDVSNINRGREISFEPNFQKPSNFSMPIQPFIKLPSEALIKALERTDLNEVRVQIVAYNSQKLFKSSQNEFVQNEMPVIQATVGNLTISKLNEPVIVIVQCFHCNLTNLLAKCVFWDENKRNWSAEGIRTETNFNNKSIICHSSHLTAFSVLFDLTPYENTEDVVILSTITYIGCYLSIIGLCLTLVTYSIFRCLNRDNSGKILIHLCISLMGLNISFIIGSEESVFGLNDSCALVAILIHYFVFTSLSWMCVEAIHIYQLLIHVFATAETHFMLKRTTTAWGLPFLWVFITVFIKPEAYHNRNNYCMISPKFPDVYYIAYLMPASVLIIVNFTVFVLATKVLFTPRMNTSKRSQCHSLVSMSQIRGAFTVMTLLGVSWIFGGIAIGEMKLVFQYIFSLANSLQGFFIFLVRCLQYPEARNAWIQLVKTGTFKKQRGQPQRLQGSWLANSNSNRLSSSDRKPSKETDSSFSVTANRSSESTKLEKLSQPFLPPDEGCDVQHFTTYDSIRVDISCQTDK